MRAALQRYQSAVDSSIGYTSRIMMNRSSLVACPAAFLLCCLTILGMLMDEVVGPILIMASLGAWMLFLVFDIRPLLHTVRRPGLVVWLLPLFAIISGAWSDVPLNTFRGGIQLSLTVLLALMTVRIVSPYRFILSLFCVTFLATLLSIAFNKVGMDQMTRSLNWSGIFSNKNSLFQCTGTLILSSTALLASRLSPNWLKASAFVALLAAVFVGTRGKAVLGYTAMTVVILCYFTILFSSRLSRQSSAAFIEASSVGMLLAAIPVAFSVLAFQDDLLRMVGKEPTLTGRTELWFYAERLKDLKPVLGWGYNAFWVHGNPFAEFLWRIMHVASRSGFHFHSIYYEVLLSLGFVGVFLAFVYLACASVTAFRAARLMPGAVSGFYFCYILYMEITQVAGVNLFRIFDFGYFVFLVSAGMAAKIMQAGRQLDSRTFHIYPTGTAVELADPLKKSPHGL